MDIPWIIEEPTKIKHELLRQYISTWMAILFSNQKRYKKNQIVVYFDGFAGPGAYFVDENKKQMCPGSPVIVAETANKFIDKDIKRRVVMFCIDNNKKCIELLGPTLQGINRHNQNWKIHYADFNKKINDILDEIEKSNLSQQPMFFFIDPFGYAGYPMETITRILKYPRSEVFINFMVYAVVRFWEEERAEDRMFELFGSNKYKNVDKSTNSEKRQLFFLNLYCKNLAEIARAKFVMPFRVNTPGQGTRPRYYLIHASQHKKALRVMKDGMARVSDVSYRFVAIGVKTPQMSFFEDPEKVTIRKRIADYCKDKSITFDFEVLENWAYLNTNGVSRTIKEALIELASDGTIEIIRQPRQRKTTVTSGAKIRFKEV